MRSRAPMIFAAAAMALASAGSAFGDDVFAARPRRQQPKSADRQKTTYDFACIGAAERKRTRKAAKLVRDMGQ